MTWPTSQIAESSAAAVWNRLCSDASIARQAVVAARAAAQAGQLTPAALKALIPQLRAARVYLNGNDGLADVQAYARLVSGAATFDLSAESAALKAVYASVIQEGRALYNAALGSMAADGMVTEPQSIIPAGSAAAFIAACQALEAAVGG